MAAGTVTDVIASTRTCWCGHNGRWHAEDGCHINGCDCRRFRQGRIVYGRASEAVGVIRKRPLRPNHPTRDSL